MENGLGLSSTGLPAMERQGSRMQVDEDSRNARYQTDTFRMLGYKVSPRGLSSGHPLNFELRLLAWQYEYAVPPSRHVPSCLDASVGNLRISSRRLFESATFDRTNRCPYLCCPYLPLRTLTQMPIIANSRSLRCPALKQGLSHRDCPGLKCQRVISCIVPYAQDFRVELPLTGSFCALILFCE